MAHNMSFVKIKAPDLYKMFKVTSPRVIKGLEQLETMNIPYYIPNIPHSTLTAMYNFIENFSIDTDFELFEHILTQQLVLDLSYLIENLTDTLNQAYYIPDFLTPAYCQTLQFQSAKCFAMHGTSPYPGSTQLKQIIFRAQCADMLELHTLKHTSNTFTTEDPPFYHHLHHQRHHIGSGQNLNLLQT